MNINTTKKQRIDRANRINAVKAAKNVPTAILVKKKAECDARALKIVEQLTEPNVETEWLLQSLGQINRTHMEDVAEERAIAKLCGYILCDNPLIKIVNKKYQISTLKNKVYDIEKIKNFCSYSCYTAMNHVIMQMLTSPLWLRNEEEIPKFTFVPRCRKRTQSPPGVEVNITGIDLVDDDILIQVSPNEKNRPNTEVKQHTTSEFETQISQNEKRDEKSLNISFNNKNEESNTLHAEKNEIIDVETDHTLCNNDDNHKIKAYLPLSDDSSALDTFAYTPKSDDECQSVQLKNLSPEPTTVQLKPKKIYSSTKNDKLVETCQENIAAKKDEDKSMRPISFQTLTTRIEQSFTEWITQDTINLLHGDDIAKQKIIDDVTRQDKYKVLCRKLNQLQLEEEKEERSLISQSDNLKPAPHYSVLEEEAKNLEVKVRAFYAGELHTKIPEKNENKISDQIAEAENIFPLTDAHDPRALRRRIFCDKLNKVLPDLLYALIGPGHKHCVYETDRIITVKTLISTFDLSATNIVFRTAEWTLVGLIIIKILGIIDPAIKSLLLTKKATMYMSMILMAYKLDSIYLDHLINSRLSPPKMNYCSSSEEDD